MKYDSKKLSCKYEITHNCIISIINNYKKDFEFFGEIEEKKIIPQKGSKGGRPAINYILNEKQKILLILYLGNSNRNIRLEKQIFVQKFFKGMIK
jgi:phage regulator Rha-like protein